MAFANFTHSFRACVAVAALYFCAAPGKAEEFYAGKTVSIVVGYGTGGGYDQAARILARHMPKHLPGNPTMVVRNMPGAGTVVAANSVNNTSLRDGTVIGMYADLMIVAPLFKIKGVQFNPREFGWLGSLASRPTPVIFVRSDAPATTLEEAKVKEVVLGSDGPGSSSSYAFMANDVFGTKFKVITGYRGGSDINLAIERGEVHGRASWDWFSLTHTKPDWIVQKKVAVLIQMALKPNPDLKDVPLAIDIAKNDEDLCVPKIRFGNIGGEVHRGSSVKRSFRRSRSTDGTGRPCSRNDAAAIHYSNAHSIAGPGVSVPRLLQ